MVIGMVAHAFRWGLLDVGASVQSGAFGACLLVGSLVSPIAHGLRIPFGAFAFASVVSLMPGVFLFQAASDALTLVGPASTATDALVLDLLKNGTTAFLITAGMTLGLIVPKMCVDQFLLRQTLARAATR